jgi:hypothetical protein
MRYGLASDLLEPEKEAHVLSRFLKHIVFQLALALGVHVTLYLLLL